MTLRSTLHPFTYGYDMIYSGRCHRLCLDETTQTSSYPGHHPSHTRTLIRARDQ